MHFLTQLSLLIKFDLHTKLTDDDLYSMPSSCHLHQIFNGVPKGLAIRAKRICSKDESFIQQNQQLRVSLMETRLHAAVCNQRHE